VKRNVIWDAMRDDGVPGKIVRLIKTYYEGMRAFVTANGELSLKDYQLTKECDRVVIYRPNHIFPIYSV